MLKRIKKIDKIVLILSIILFGIGLLFIFSSSNVFAFRKYGDSYSFIYRQLIWLGAGLFATVLFNFFSIRSYKFFSILGIIFSIVTLFLVLQYGQTIGNAKSWFKIGGFATLQPSEFVKIFIIMFMASYYGAKKQVTGVKIYIPVVISFICGYLIYKQPDLGTTIIFMSIAMFTFFSSPIPFKHKLGCGLLGALVIVIGAVALISSDFNILGENQKKRVTMLDKNPCSEEYFYNDGNQLCNGYIAINNGGLTGLGIGNSIQKNLYLQSGYSDFIICIIVEEIGFLGASVIFFLYFLLILRIVTIGRRANNSRSAVLCYGVAFYIFIHIIVNLGGVFGKIPMTGVPLPFMSYGGSYACCLIFSIGLVERVAIENYNNREKILNSKK